MNNYLLTERLEFMFKTNGIDSTEAFEKHCQALSQLIDYGRSIGLEVNEWEPTDCTCYRIEGNDGREVLDNEWKKTFKG